MNSIEKDIKEKIILIGSYGRGNAGDDAFVFAALKLFSNFKIVINCANENDLPKEIRDNVITIKTHGLSDVFKKIQLFFDTKYIVYGGGDLWVELHGERFPRASLWKMVFVNLISRIFCKKVFYLGVGIGNISGFSLFLARISAKLSNYIITRDLKTTQLLKIKNIKQLPDLTINLFEENNLFLGLEQKFKNNKEVLIGISILYFLPNRERNFPLLINELQKLFDIVKDKNIKFIIIPFLISKDLKHDDLWSSKQILNNYSYKNVEIFKSNDLIDILSLIPKLDLMIGTRLHANILAIFSGIPSLGISYRPKVQSFFDLNDLNDFCIDIKDLDQLVPRTLSILNNLSETKDIFEKVREAALLKKHVYENIITELFK